LCGKPVSGWEKALLHFARQRPRFVWFLEDDVYLYGEDTLQKIDQEDGGRGDLLSQIHDRSVGEGRTDWFWPTISKSLNLQPPYSVGMMCAVRMSAAMLEAVRCYAAEHKTLDFLEVFFPTLADKMGLTLRSPPELSSVTFRHKHYWLDPRNVYHPIKRMDHHTKIRAAQKILISAAAEAVQPPVAKEPPRKGRSQGNISLFLKKG
jgi:hypothetical protein